MEPVALPGGSCSPACGGHPGGSLGCCEERLACLGRGGDACACRDSAFVEVENREHQEVLTEDDIYCRCLSKTLCHTATPVTVGVYVPCCHRLYSLLDKVTEVLTEDDIYCRCLSKTLCHTATPVTVGVYAPCCHRLYSLLDKVTEVLTEDDIYCRCLSKTLCHTATPVTVGVYAPCCHRLYSLLDKVTEVLTEDDIYCRCLSKTLCHTATPVTVGVYAPCCHRLYSLLDKVTEVLTEDDIYCRCLSKTLCHTATPVTVGVYAPCCHRLYSLLDKVTEVLTEDDIYCRCLSKTLCHTATPVTVGVYAPCCHRLYSLLDKVTEVLTEDDIYCRCLSKTLCHTATPVTVGVYAPCCHRLYSLLDKVTEVLTEDDIYCRCLSKTLCHTATPVTVGVYAPCCHRLYSLLDKVTGFMREEMAQREVAELHRSHQKPRSPEGWGLLLVLWYLAFYKPVITEGHLRRKNIEFIFIRFSAWQYAGCDKLWAGLVTTLCDNIRHHFGALPLSVYHVMGTRPRFASGFSQKEWLLKRGTCLKLWGLLFVLVAGLSVLLVALLVPGIKDNHALKVVGSTITSLSGSSLVLGAFSILKNLLVSEKQKIERLTNSEKFASQLGFMSQVHREVEVLVDFLAFMEIFERRRLRVVLEITSLDICYPEKVAGVLNAMNTLLSDANTPFIFILAVDPSVIIPCLEQTGCMKGLADNGYLYLNRTVTLPFSIPEMGARSRLRYLEAAVQTREDLMYRIITSNVERRRAKCQGVPEVPSRREMDAEAVRCIHEAFRCLHDSADPLARYPQERRSLSDTRLPPSRSASRESRNCSQGRPQPRSPSPAGPRPPCFDPTAFVRARQRRQKEAERKNQRSRAAFGSTSLARSSSAESFRSWRSAVSSGSEADERSELLPPRGRSVTRTRRLLSAPSCNSPDKARRPAAGCKLAAGSAAAKRASKENHREEPTAQLSEIDTRLQALQEYMDSLATHM